MPWYKYKTMSTRGDRGTNFTNIIAQPFTVNNVVFDYDNLHNYTTQLTHNSSNEVSAYTVYAGSVGYSFYSFNAAPGSVYIGFPCLIYSKELINNNLFIEVPTTNINGKYKLKNNIISLTDIDLRNGITLPIKANINGKSFKYLIVSGSKEWLHNKNGSGKYIGGYNTPSKFVSIETPPKDFTTYNIGVGNTINIDFGINNQEVPQYFYDWFLQQFDKVYENTYTIKSTTGETLTTLTEAPPMISATLSAVGNAKYLTLKGENNTNYTMEWTSETPQGKILAGLATSKGGSIVIPVGKTSTINLTDSTDLYEVWQTYRPPTTTFDINLYKNSAEPNKVDKTAELSTVGTISGVLRQECSLINPEIIIQYDKPPDFNYCYIANFGRYYYIENIVSMRQNLWRVRLRCDVLMTYKTQILNLTARIARQQYTYSYRQIDSEIPFTNDPEITVQDIPNNLNLGKPMQDNILLTVVDNGT